MFAQNGFQTFRRTLRVRSDQSFRENHDSKNFFLSKTFLIIDFFLIKCDNLFLLLVQIPAFVKFRLDFQVPVFSTHKRGSVKFQGKGPGGAGVPDTLCNLLRINYDGAHRRFDIFMT